MSATIRLFPGCVFCGPGAIGKLLRIRVGRPDGTIGDRSICWTCACAIDAVVAKETRELEEWGWRLAGTWEKT